MKDAHTKETQRMIEVMQAYADGEQIQCRSKHTEPWLDCVPTWSWTYCEYRIKTESALVREIKQRIRETEGDARICESYVNAARFDGIAQGLREALQVVEAQGE